MNNPFKGKKVKTISKVPLPDSLPEPLPIEEAPEEEVEEITEEPIEEVSIPGTMANFTDFGVVDEYGNRIPCASLAEAKILSLLIEIKGGIK